MSGDTYFVYCSELGYETFTGEVAANDEVLDRLAHYREEAVGEGEWQDYVESLQWGKVLQQAKPTTTQEDGKEFTEFNLEDV